MPPFMKLYDMFDQTPPHTIDKIMSPNVKVIAKI